MPQADALTAIFDEIVKVYDKICALNTDLLKIGNVSELFDSDGNLVSLAPTFDPVDTDGNPAVEASIQEKIEQFNQYMLDLVNAARNGNPPPTGSDCQVLKVCSKRGQINSQIESFNNVPSKPEDLALLVATAISKVKDLLDGALNNIRVNQIPDLFDFDGNLISDPDNDRGKILLDNPDNLDSITALQNQLNSDWQDFLGFLRSYRDIFPEEPDQADRDRLQFRAGFDGVLNGFRFLVSGKSFATDILISVVKNLISDLITNILNGGTSGSDGLNTLVFPGEQFEHQRITTQLNLIMVMAEPANDAEKRSTWNIHIPAPRPCEEYEWCRDFEPIQRTLGAIRGTVRYQNYSGKTYAYCKDETDADQFLRALIGLSTLTPVTNSDNKPYRISLYSTPRRQPRERLLKVKYATWVEFDENSAPTKIYRFSRPSQGC